MAHPLIDQLRFTRSEWLRALDGVSAQDALHRFEPMNSIGWTVGHLAWQEQRYWLTIPQGQTPVPELNTLVGYGRPATTPPLADMLTAWRTITNMADTYLDQMTSADLANPIEIRGWITTTPGSLMLRVVYHYWYHIGEIMAIRQQLGHANLPEFVGNIDEEMPYRPE
ncbi:MAG: DinB family protein [Caldilineaceae bacterium]|nr:DinB family protein [Caldilineaceae bacterium]